MLSIHSCLSAMQSSFLNLFLLHLLHVIFVVVLLTLFDLGSHKRIGLAPIPSLSFPTIAKTGTPTAAAICNGPASTLITAFVSLQIPLVRSVMSFLLGQLNYFYIYLNQIHTPRVTYPQYFLSCNLFL